MKTIKLKLHIRERYILAEPFIRNALVGASFVVFLLLISRLLSPAPAPVVITLRPAILVQTAQPLPTWTPAPTSEPLVQYIILPTPEPEVIYVESPPVTPPEAPQQAEEAAPMVEAAPTPGPVYSVLSERQANIRAHYPDAIPTRAPMQDDAPAPTQTLADAIATTEMDLQQAGGQASPAWKMEHCIGSGASEVCH